LWEEPQELTPMAMFAIIWEEQRIQIDHMLSSLNRIDNWATEHDERLMSLSMHINTVKEGYDEHIEKITDLTGKFTTFQQNIDKTTQQAAPIPSTDRDQQSSIDDLYNLPGDRLYTPT
jgi:predicted  nucleic acid-binding Zn-ribbon protein